MIKTKLFSLLMVPLIAFLGYSLYDGIHFEIVQRQIIEDSEAKVKERLIMIRNAQKAYKSIHGVYAPNFDTLIEFVKNGQMYIVEKKEIIPEKIRTASDYYVNEIVIIEIDTLGVENVWSKLYPKADYPDFNPDDLRKIPGQEDKEFDMFIGTITSKTGLELSVVEVVDRYPLDKTRKEDHPLKLRRPLRFGSRTTFSLAGNW